MHIFVKQQIRHHTSFCGARDDNVIQWLQHTEAICDRVQLQPVNKYQGGKSATSSTSKIF